jgi:hypothetical protein
MIAVFVPMCLLQAAAVNSQHCCQCLQQQQLLLQLLP